MADTKTLVAVKPLEWDDQWAARASISGRTKRTIMERALTPFHAYFIEQSPDDDSWWLLIGLLGDEIGGPFEHDWQARAAAQADYDASIRSALAEPLASHEARIAELEGLLARARDGVRVWHGVAVQSGKPLIQNLMDEIDAALHTEGEQMGAKLRKTDLRGYEELTQWVVVAIGEGHQDYPSREEAVASAKEQAECHPGIVLGLYRLEAYVSARVQPPQLFDPETK